MCGTPCNGARKKSCGCWTKKYLGSWGEALDSPTLLARKGTAARSRFSNNHWTLTPKGLVDDIWDNE